MPHYVAVTTGLIDNSLTIIDVSDPAAPVFAGHIAGAGAPNYLMQAMRAFYFFLPSTTPIDKAYALAREEL
jgi:hypothetical protein